MKINLHKPNFSIQIGNDLTLKHQSTPISIRNKHKAKHINKFSASLEYLAKLHTLSNHKLLNKTPPPERITSSGFINPDHNIFAKTSNNSPSTKINTHTSLGTAVLSFLNDMTNLQRAICQKSMNVNQLKKDFEHNKKQLMSSALKSLGKSQTTKSSPIKQQNSSFEEVQYYLNEENKKLKEEIASIKKKQVKSSYSNSHSSYNISLITRPKTCNIATATNPYPIMTIASTQTEENNLQEMYSMLKELYQTMKTKERNYSIDFNYDTNNLLYFNKTNPINDNQLLENCQMIQKELLVIISNISDSFDKSKSNMNVAMTSLKEENKTNKTQINEFKKVINEYMKLFHNFNSSLYSSEDLIKIFKKNYEKTLSDAKIKEQKNGEYEKELKLYKTMSDSYKQALKESDITIGKLEQEIKNISIKYASEIKRENSKIESQEDFLKDQIIQLKNELKETKEQSTVELIGPIKDALTRLVLEMNLTSKTKDYLNVIFKLLGFNEDQINNVYLMKDTKKKYLPILKGC